MIEQTDGTGRDAGGFDPPDFWKKPLWRERKST